MHVCILFIYYAMIIFWVVPVSMHSEFCC